MRDILHAGHSHVDEDAETESGVLGLQVASFFLTFLIVVAFVLLPLRLHQKKIFQNQVLLSSLNCLSGGIFLGFAFLHILPDATAGFREWNEDAARYPVIPALCLAGFFTVLIVEKIIYTKVLQRDVNLGSAGKKETLKDPVELRDVENVEADKEKDVTLDVKEESKHHCESGDHMHEGHFHTHDVPFRTNSKVTPFVISISLCFHSIFEGVALGIQKQMSSLIALLIGIALHKVAEAFAMGISFAKSGTPWKHWVPLMLCFAFAVPLGMAVGLSLTATGSSQDLISSLLGAFATGSFLYVTLLGVIVEEFSGFTRLWSRLTFFLSGVASMGLLFCLVEYFG